ncbi:MAG: type VI secretion system ATPase TssH [Planctomycetota bacterium]|jgi:type VI secretion system protein VasG
MAEIARTKLFGKLNSLAYKSVEGATVFCKLRGNPYVELLHWLHQIVQLQDSDLHRILKHFEIDSSRLAADMTSALDGLPRGATSISDFSPHLEESVERGWLYGSLMFNESAVRSGHLVLGILKTRHLKNVLLAMSGEFGKIKEEALAGEFGQIVGGSPEDNLWAQDGSAVGGGASPGEAAGATAPAQMGKQEALNRFATDLTANARKGEMDPIVGRDMEIRQIIDILMRRRQNNPILTGEAGVGKTAVVEGFAQRIAAGDVPPPLKNVRLLTLDIGLLQAGASMKGEFENRLRQVIEEVQSSETPIILFIDEAHTLIGAGGASGTGDAANLLKPALARGTLRTVAATTHAEYKKYIEKDPALTRRFQVVKVDEPDEDSAIRMMRALAPKLESHHKAQLLDEALEAAVKLSHRYIPARLLPDKSVSLLDTACARVAVSQHGTPAELEDSIRNVEALERELGIIGREEALGVEHDERKADVEEDLAAERKRRGELEEAVAAERELVGKILDARAKLHRAAATADAETPDAAGAPEEGKPAGDAPEEGAGHDAGAAEGEPAADAPSEEFDREACLAELKELQKELAEMQGETPHILPSVDEQAVASVVGDWTGIPVGRMVTNEMAAVLGLADTLEERVIGQRHALDALAKRIQTSRAGIDDPGKPVGVFLFVGPSGVGKTELALALGETMYGGEHNVVTINMSEYQEAHTVSLLKGAPPGYVGYGEGGVLTEAVRRRPYSVVLLDEVEKAHSDVHEIFFQVFDKGFMEDSEGRSIDFKNTVIILTSNVGTDLIMNMCKDPELMPDPEGLVKAVREPLLKVFPPALLGRLVVIPFYPISDPVLRLIIELKLGRIVKRMAAVRKIPLTYGDPVVDLIANRCTEVASGARMVDAIVTNTLLPTISREFLTKLMEGVTVKGVNVTAADDEFGYEFT